MLEEISRLRVRYILGELSKDALPPEALVEIDKYGIDGKIRTIDDYFIASGVNFRTRVIEERALFGGVSKELFYEDLASKVLGLVGAANK